MSFHNLVNTAQFQYTARDFKTNGGMYTRAPKGSRDYFQFWEEEEKRCLYGYKCGDLWIPGRFYHYLNHFPIARVPEKVMLQAIEERRSSGTGRVARQAVEKIMDFPAFWEIAYEWYMFKHIAWYGGEFMGIQSPGNRHICTLKTRGAGFSYWEAQDGCYNYNFIPGSKSYYFAGALPYLDEDGIMNKVQGGLDWTNQHSPYWKKNRQVHKSVLHQKASYLDMYGMEKGSMSEIIGQVVDKPSKTRGKRGRKATFEEGGSFAKMEEALEVAMGSMAEGADEEGTMYVGQITIGGTGGEQGPGIQGLENIFDNPKAWDMLAFPNVWDGEYNGGQCGYFVPCWRANSWAMDENGNVDIDFAIKADDTQRDKKKKSNKPKDLDRRIAEYPRNPREALQRMNGNGFNIAEIDAQIKRLESSKQLQGMIRHGQLTRNPDALKNDGHNGVEFNVQPKHIAKPIEDFPHNQRESMEGCVSIVERPYTDAKGRVPEGMYKITFDGYAKEQAEDQTSLWSWKVWKMDNNVDPKFGNLPVAWGCGRMSRYQSNIDRMFMAADYYNAMIQGEIAGGGQAVVTHAKTYRLLHKICHEPEMAHNKEIASKSAGNSYLMNMATDRKNLGLSYLEDWHVQIRGLDEKGIPILNVHRIYDIAWLKEMRKFDPTKGNYDRISDAIVGMFELKENYALQIKRRRKQRAFWEKTHYAESTDTSETTSAY